MRTPHAILNFHVTLKTRKKLSELLKKEIKRQGKHVTIRAFMENLIDKAKL